MGRRFKKSTFKASDTGKMFTFYDPTVHIKGSTMINDKSFKKFRGSDLDKAFAVPKRRRK